MPRGSSASANGTLTAVWGDNLSDWNLTPVYSRFEYQSFATCWYDPKAAKWSAASVDADNASDDAQAALSHRFKAPGPGKDAVANERPANNGNEAERS